MKASDMDDNILSDVVNSGGKGGKKNTKAKGLRRRIHSASSTSSDSDNDSKISFTYQELREMSELYLTLKKLMIDDKGVTIAQSLSSISNSLEKIVKKM